MKRKIMILGILTFLVGGCTATITPRGDIYTEALLPSAVVVESYSRPVIVSAPHRHSVRPMHKPMGPIASRHRAGGKSSSHRFNHGYFRH